MTSSSKRLSQLFGVGVALTLAFTGCSRASEFSPPESVPESSILQQFSAALDCGTVTYANTQQRLVAVQAVTCDEAKKVIAASDANETLPAGWECSVGRDGSSSNLTCFGTTNTDPRLLLLQNPDLPMPTGR